MSVSPTTIANSLEVSFFLSRTTNLITPSLPTADKSGSWYTAAALSNLSSVTLSIWKHTSFVGRSISFSGGVTITWGSAKKYYTLRFPSRIVRYVSSLKSKLGSWCRLNPFKNWFRS